MAITNPERVGKAMDLLKAGLGPFVEREIKTAGSGKTGAWNLNQYANDPMLADKPVSEWDAAALLKLMRNAWNDVFGKTLGRAKRDLVFEMRDHRNDWAHQRNYSSDDAYRALDSAGC